MELVASKYLRKPASRESDSPSPQCRMGANTAGATADEEITRSLVVSTCASTRNRCKLSFLVTTLFDS